MRSTPHRPTVADLFSAPVHTGPLDGADAIGEAVGVQPLLVRVGLWRVASASGDQVRARVCWRARWRASTCPALIALSELACRLVEAGLDPAVLDEATLRAEVAGLHPGHGDRADLVARAVRAAAARASEAAAPSPPAHPSDSHPNAESDPDAHSNAESESATDIERSPPR